MEVHRRVVDRRFEARKDAGASDPAAAVAGAIAENYEGWIRSGVFERANEGCQLTTRGALRTVLRSWPPLSNLRVWAARRAVARTLREFGA